MRMLRVPKYCAGLVDPYREHLRTRRAQDPAVPVAHLFEEIKARGFTGCLNLLHKYINQGRADADRSHISPHRLARMILTRPDNLKPDQRTPQAPWCLVGGPASGINQWHGLAVPPRLASRGGSIRCGSTTGWAGPANCCRARATGRSPKRTLVALAHWC